MFMLESGGKTKEGYCGVDQIPLNKTPRREDARTPIIGRPGIMEGLLPGREEKVGDGGRGFKKQHRMRRCC